jgi:hypothetical protein
MLCSIASRLAWTLAFVVAPATALAQTNNATLAQSLFEKARQLMTDGRYDEACPLLAESQRLDAGGGTLLNLAVCHEREGRLATAWSEFGLAISVAVKDGRKDREALARARVDALAPRLSHLVVRVPSASQSPDLTITIDGTALSPAAWGVATAVDLGSHRVEADAPGRAHWTITVLIDGESQTRAVEVPQPMPSTEASPAEPQIPVPPPRVIFTSPPSPPTVAGPTKVASKSAARYAVGAVSLAALGLGIAAGVVALVEHGDAEKQCDTSRQFCATQSGISDQSAAVAWGWVSTTALGAGLVGASAFVLWPRVTVPARVGVVAMGGGGRVVADLVF